MLAAQVTMTIYCFATCLSCCLTCSGLAQHEDQVAELSVCIVHVRKQQLYGAPFGFHDFSHFPQMPQWHAGLVFELQQGLHHASHCKEQYVAEQGLHMANV